MSKDDQQIMAVETDILLGPRIFQGFRSHEEHDYEAAILGNFKTMKRGDLETDPTHKQPIGYMIIANQDKMVFVYQRSQKDKEYGEARLQGKYSWGVGGHIETHDLTGENPLVESMLRELSEEILIEGDILGTQPLGYINDDSDPVGQVHFGVLYLTRINGRAVPRDSEIASGSMRNIKGLESLSSSPNVTVENWSKIALDPLRQHFS